MSSQHPTATAENYSPRTKNSFFEKFKRRRTKFPLAARAAAVLQRGFWTYPPEQFFNDVVTCAGSGVRHPMRGGVRRRCASASAQIATLLACLSSARVFIRTIERRTRRGFFSTACQPRSSLDSWVQCFPKADADAVNKILLAKPDLRHGLPGLPRCACNRDGLVADAPIRGLA